MISQDFLSRDVGQFLFDRIIADPLRNRQSDVDRRRTAAGSPLCAEIAGIKRLLYAVWIENGIITRLPGPGGGRYGGKGKPPPGEEGGPQRSRRPAVRHRAQFLVR